MQGEELRRRRASCRRAEKRKVDSHASLTRMCTIESESCRERRKQDFDSWVPAPHAISIRRLLFCCALYFHGYVTKIFILSCFHPSAACDGDRGGMA